MTLYLVPKTYAGVAINNVNGIDTQAFQLPAPKQLSGLRQVAGGELFDFHYGTGAILIPSPFTVVMTCTGATAAAFGTLFNSFFGLPPTGKYGTVNTFVADVHGAGTTMSCQAELANVQFTQNAAWYDTSKRRLAGIQVTFRPKDLFS